MERKPLERKVTIETVLFELLQKKEWLDVTHALARLADQVQEQERRLIVLEARYADRKPTIQRVEEFNGESAPPPEDNLRMKYADKIQSMKNALAILPPNLVEHGRHTKENVQSICGFLVTPEMLDDAYEGLT